MRQRSQYNNGRGGARLGSPDGASCIAPWLQHFTLTASVDKYSLSGSLHKDKEKDLSTNTNDNNTV